MALLKNRKAVVATVAAVATAAAAASAYYYYSNVRATTEKSKKDKKKKNKKKKKATASEPATSDKAYLTINGDEEKPDMAAMLASSEDQKKVYATALKDKGNALFKEKRFEDAIEFYNHAIKLHEDPVFHSNISACYVSLGDLDKVVESSTRALELKPDYSKALLRRASAYENMGRYQDAMFDISVLSLNGDFNGSSIEPMLERNLNKQALRVLKEDMGIDASDWPRSAIVRAK